MHYGPGCHVLLPPAHDRWNDLAADPRSDISQLWAMFLELERTQWLDAAALDAAQLTQVRALLSHCVQHVPYYQAAGIVPADVRSMADFRRIPILQRRSLSGAVPTVLRRRCPTASSRRRGCATSGTSGLPIEVLQTNLVNMWWLVFQLRNLRWSAIDPRGSLAAIRTIQSSESDRPRLLEGVSLPYWGQQLHSLIETGPSYAMDIHQEPRRQLDWLPRCGRITSSAIRRTWSSWPDCCAKSANDCPACAPSKVSAKRSPRRCALRIEEGFGVPVKNTYSCVEAGYLASPCPEGHGLHVHAENVLLEVLDESGHPCRPGETGRVVLTTLHNYLTPFVRYEILDGATLGPERCPCGRGLPLLTRVLGKQRPQFRLADGRRKDSGFLVRHLRRLGGYHQHQIVQRAVDHVIVRLVPDRSWTADHPAQVVQGVRDYFEAPIRVDVETPERLEITPAGKLHDVICEIRE